jgi:transposase
VVTDLMRIAWRTVGAIITRVWADTAGGVDLFAVLRRIGIDKISYKRNYKYLTVVVGWCSHCPMRRQPLRSRPGSRSATLPDRMVRQAARAIVTYKTEGLAAIEHRLSKASSNRATPTSA